MPEIEEVTVTVVSMTGFARGQGVVEGPEALAWTWEVRSVNGRGLDVRLRTPPGFDALDGPARALVGRHLTRGNVALTLSVESERETTSLVINRDLLESLATTAAEVARRHPDLAPARIDGLMGVRGVLEPAAGDTVSGEDADAVRARRNEALLTGLEEALRALCEMRLAEGERLRDVLTGLLDRIDDLRRRAVGLAATQPETLRERLRQQVAALLDVSSVPSEERLHQEAALLAVKTDVREELDRLDAHVAAARDLLAKAGPVGRRLDFLCQEFNREANTLCSKSADTDLTAVGLDLKTTIDQMREQVQNIE